MVRDKKNGEYDKEVMYKTEEQSIYDIKSLKDL